MCGYIQSQYGTNPFQGKRQPHRSCPGHRTFPGAWIKVLPGGIAKIAGQADAFKVGVECPLGYHIILQSGYDVCRNLLSAGKVDQLNGTAVHAVGKEQDFKYRRLHITIHTGLGEVLIAVRLDID